MTPSLYTPVSTHKMEATSRATSIPLSPSAPRCASHRRPAVLRVVHKEGENKGRQFYSCSLPRDTKCNFFEVKVEGSLSVFDLLLLFSLHSLFVSDLFTKHLNNWNKSLQLYIQANQTLFPLLQWADLHFPFCHHGKRCLMRTVLKLGPNNGRNFYTCSFQKGKQCDFFLWAENGPGVSILPGC